MKASDSHGRLTGAVTSVQKVLLLESRLAERSSSAVDQDKRMHRESGKRQQDTDACEEGSAQNTCG